MQYQVKKLLPSDFSMFQKVRMICKLENSTNAVWNLSSDEKYLLCDKPDSQTKHDQFMGFYILHLQTLLQESK